MATIKKQNKKKLLLLKSTSRWTSITTLFYFQKK